MNILVIDDTPVNVTLCKSLIKKIPGCEAFGFSDGLQALAWCENNIPDLVLVDYMMPAPDGIEFIRIFRDIAGFQEIPVVMITALDDREINRVAMNKLNSLSLDSGQSPKVGVVWRIIVNNPIL